MFRVPLRLLAAAALALALAGCEDSKADLLQKAEGAKTRAELRTALGGPDEVNKVGPIETWTYAASDGSVTFTLAGDSVTLTTTGPKPQ